MADNERFSYHVRDAEDEFSEKYAVEPINHYLLKANWLY